MIGAMSNPRYPIGEMVLHPDPTAADRAVWTDQIAQAPASLRDAVVGLDESQLGTPYRQGGWTVRQLVHHVADSHMNGYVRSKLALTEDVPTVKTYEQDRWAMLADVDAVPIEASLQLLDALHVRWAAMWRSMSDADFARSFQNPELGVVTLGTHLGVYAWHGRHHVANITALRTRSGW